MDELQQIQDFLESYAEQQAEHALLAHLAEEYVCESLCDREYNLHQVTGRAKGLESLRGKLLQKHYADPARQVTDLIGVRVITYYAEQVDAIVERLRLKFVVDKANSFDKRSSLVDAGIFGYRSVHIVGHLSRAAAVPKKYADLRGRTLEIQVRSVLDHAWSEIEHELVYKSGFVHEAAYRRRFAAVAGTFEILEREFVKLKAEKNEIVDHHRGDYQRGVNLGSTFDAARMIAAFEVLRAGARGWRNAESAGSQEATPPRMALAALVAVGITNYRIVRDLLRSRVFNEKVENYAALAQVAPVDVSHQSLVALLVGHRSQPTLALYFPELIGYPLIDAALRPSLSE